MIAPPISPARPIWREPEPLPADFRHETIHANALLAELLYRRGISDRDAAAAFLSTRREATPDPYQLPNMAAAVARLGAAITRGERVGIFGDYDVDGITSSALLALALRTALGEERVTIVLPERSEGYGLNRRGIDRLRAARATLLIAVDCGSSDHEHVAYAREQGLDVLILDHHQMRDTGPEGAIVVSPRLRDDEVCHELTAVGVAYLLVAALAREGHPVAGQDERDLLDLVALGTVADVAPLTGCNRPLVRDGLAVLRRTARPGLRVLFARAEVAPAKVTAEDIAFRLAPRLNAAGRLASPELALRLILARDEREAMPFADEIERLNRQRKALAETVTRDALATAVALPDWERRPLLVLVSDCWQPGVLGAVASRLVEQLGRPVVLLHGDGETVHGSARSVPGFDIAAAFSDLSHLLTRHGGHSLAAGIGLDRRNLEALETGLVEAVERLDLVLPAPRAIDLDADLPAERLTLDTVRALEALEPCGSGNETPMFLLRDARVIKYATLGADRRHLRITIELGRTQADAICWGGAGRSSELLLNRTIDIAGKLQINRWNGKERLQLIAEDFRPAVG